LAVAEDPFGGLVRPPFRQRVDTFPQDRAAGDLSGTRKPVSKPERLGIDGDVYSGFSCHDNTHSSVSHRIG